MPGVRDPFCGPLDRKTCFWELGYPTGKCICAQCFQNEMTVFRASSQILNVVDQENEGYCIVDDQELEPGTPKLDGF